MRGADRLPAILLEAGARARATGRRVLVSVVERVAAVDPLEGLECAFRSAARLEDSSAARMVSPRMYWSRPTDGFTLAGLGSAVTLAPEGADRFATVDREWNTLIADAMIDDDSSGMSGAGPTLMGGFAFDPEGPRTEAWREFPAAHLFVPRLQLLRAEDECWLTTTLLVGIDGRSDVEAGALERARRWLLAGDTDTGASSIAPVEVTLAHTDVRDPREWRATVRDAVTAIRAGRLEKVVLAREVTLSAPRDFDVATALRQLQSEHPSCYIFGCWHDDSVFIGATPERLARADGANIQASSLAGSVSRGRSLAEDAMNSERLLASAKDRAEHEIVRQALCAGLERLCDDVTAEDGPSLLSLPNVHHLHTAVRARLRAGHTLLQVVAQLHPTPAVGGAPRNAALRFIREHEKMDRGWYAAPIGWVQRDRGEFAVALRSALVSGSESLLFAGCGIVADSDPVQEYAESLLKLRPMESALAAAAAQPDAESASAEESADEQTSAVWGGASS